MGLDLSVTGTGLVVLQGEWVVHRRLISTDPADGSHHHRFSTIACAIAEVCREYEPDLVGIENYAFGKQFGTQPLMELGGVVKHYLYHEECPWTTIPPQSLKAWAHGGKIPKANGMSKPEHRKFLKASMIELAREGGCETFDDNVADAFHVARWASANFRDLISEALETVA